MSHPCPRCGSRKWRPVNKRKKKFKCIGCGYERREFR
jgi:predicted RNA-binding Zn-ribbon protein involved in translation (DUF1610 family)